MLSFRGIEGAGGSSETFLFLGVLFQCAVVASGYVLREGL